MNKSILIAFMLAFFYFSNLVDAGQKKGANTMQCADSGGCYQGWCWRKCANNATPGWCYSYPNGQGGIRCTQDSECTQHLCAECYQACQLY
jgi:hypothetical protein